MWARKRARNVDGVAVGGVRTIDAYIKAEKVGEGTYGEVFRGVDRRTRTSVALKKVRMMRRPRSIPKAVVREIKLLRSLPRHRNVIQVIDVVTDKSTASAAAEAQTLAEEAAGAGGAARESTASVRRRRRTRRWRRASASRKTSPR